MLVGSETLECMVRSTTDEIYRWRRFVALSTMDDPRGCQVVVACPSTDLGTVPVALVEHVLSVEAPDDVRRAAVAALLEGMSAAVGILEEEYPELAAILR